MIYTDVRPVPLHHYIYPAGAEGLHLVVDETGRFREDNFSAAMATLRDVSESAKGDKRVRRSALKGLTNDDKNNVFSRNLNKFFLSSSRNERFQNRQNDYGTKFSAGDRLQFQQKRL